MMSVMSMGLSIGSRLVFIDYLILALLLVGLIYGACVGFLREFVNLILWAVSFTVAVYCFRPISVLLSPYIHHPMTCLTISFIVVFYAVFLCGILIRFLLFRSQGGESPGVLSRLLGAGIGVFKALALVAMLVWLLSLTSMPESSYWKQSYLLGQIQDASHDIWRLTESDHSVNPASSAHPVNQGAFDPSQG